MGETVRPYGDTVGDGMVQLSFTLPIPSDARAEPAALALAATMGLSPAMVAHSRGIGPDFTFFVVYGRLEHGLDLATVSVPERDYPLLAPDEVDAVIRTTLGRALVVVGGCIGTDAHTVGIDAICNLKGFAGHKGLESYRQITVVNLGAQLAVADLVGAAQSHRADAVLVSQIVTQRDAHLANVAALAAALRAAYPGRAPLLVAGGPRFDTAAARGLGVDRIFTRGATPSEVASYLAHAVTARVRATS